MKEKTVVVTDSGLGGMSVVAELCKKLSDKKSSNLVRVVFFNSLFYRKSGYNFLKTQKEKARYFDQALKAMMKYEPDLIAIACHTLSFICPLTRFFQNPLTSVTDISQSALSAFEKIPDPQNSIIILLGTSTTARESRYRQQLKIETIIQACPWLVKAIENNREKQAADLIEKYLGLALGKINQTKKIYLGLTCTHFSYKEDEFKQALIKNKVKNFEIINPNLLMAQDLFDQLGRQKARVSVEVVSKTRLNQNFVSSLSSSLKEISPQTGLSLKNYSYQPHLF